MPTVPLKTALQNRHVFLPDPVVQSKHQLQSILGTNYSVCLMLCTV